MRVSNGAALQQGIGFIFRPFSLTGENSPTVLL